jgi:hypothetical protein
VISLEYASRILIYCPLSGNIYWQHRPDRNKSWNTRYSGKVAGTERSGGYIYLNIDGSNFHEAHRLAWLIHYKEPPNKDIDHIDGNPRNNRISNLRLATPSQNMMNRGKQSNNTSGYKGVSYRKDRKKWRAYIKKEGKFMALGHYDSKKDAYSAYCDAARKYHGAFARLA